MKKLALLLAITFIGLAGPSAQAEGLVSIEFEVTIAGEVQDSACSLSVIEGTKGVGVLDAALADDCIDSYETSSQPWGTWLDCINEICGQDRAVADAAYVGTFWEILLGGSATVYGLNGYSAQDGDAIAFNYTSYAFLPTVTID